MNPSLRKIHRRIWIAFAVILPVLFVAAVLVIPDEVKQEILYQNVESGQIQQKEVEDSIQKQLR